MRIIIIYTFSVGPLTCEIDDREQKEELIVITEKQKSVHVF